MNPLRDVVFDLLLGFYGEFFGDSMHRGMHTIADGAVSLCKRRVPIPLLFLWYEMVHVMVIFHPQASPVYLIDLHPAKSCAT